MLAFPMCSLAFPDYENPFEPGPPVISPPLATACNVTLFANAALSQYGQREVRTYSPLDCGTHHWHSIILEFHGSVKGVQFDRYGALWLGGVELLRLTTPEPYGPTQPAPGTLADLGITWSVSRDLTEYAPLFTRASNATLAIPNVVDDTYTGVLYINATLRFFPAHDDAQEVSQEISQDSAQSSRPLAAAAVAPLRDITADPFAGGNIGMSVAGGENFSAPLKLPKRDVVGVSCP